MWVSEEKKAPALGANSRVTKERSRGNFWSDFLTAVEWGRVPAPDSCSVHSPAPVADAPILVSHQVEGGRQESRKEGRKAGMRQERGRKEAGMRQE